MKKAFRTALLVVTVSLSVAGCKSNKSGSAADSVKVDSSSSVKSSSDSTMKTDTVKPATDTSEAKVDTTSKTVTKSTEVKKVVAKKKQ